MTRVFDVIVVGLGAMGSAALRALARRGRRVLGLDAFSPPHVNGSSHGRSRIIREAYFEHPAYVPIVQRAYRLWEDLERESGEALMVRTGGLMIGPPEGVLVSGALRSAREHGLEYEQLDAPEMRRRFPAFRPDAGMTGVWEPRAGVLFPESCVAAFLESARKSGAVIRTDEPARSWTADGDGVEVATARERYRADQVLLSAGPWIDRLVPELHAHLRVERVVQFWFEPRSDPELFEPARCPISLWEHERDHFFYAFPRFGSSVKIALHHEGSAVDPDHVAREVGSREAEPLRELMDRYMPAAGGRLETSAVCLYTNTEDGHFLIDRHPLHPQALIVSACSGHGFKFAPAIGEIAAELLVEGRTGHDLSLFGWGRLGLAAGDGPVGGTTARTSCSGDEHVKDWCRGLPERDGSA